MEATGESKSTEHHHCLSSTAPLSPLMSFLRAAITTETKWLTHKDISSLIVLEARSLKSGCQQGHAPSETLGGLLARPLLVAGVILALLGLLLRYIVSASVVTSVLLVYPPLPLDKGTSHID